MPYLVITVDESELPSQAVKVFAWWSKKYMQSSIILMEDHTFSVH